MIEDIRLTTALMSARLPVREATERRWTRSSLAYCCLEERTERPVRPLSAAALLSEVVALRGRGVWSGVRGCSTIGPKVPSAPVDIRDSVGDVEGDLGGTVAGLAVDAEMYAAESGTDDGGVFLSLELIVLG